MSPRIADPKTRQRLIETAARVLAEEGTAALTARRLARELGTSTTAVYTHFGGMTELRREIRREGFARLAEHLAGAPRSDDPVTELTNLGTGYCVNAFLNPHLYRTMLLEAPLDPEDAATGLDTYERLVAAVERCIAEGRFPRCPDAATGAAQIWAMTHGFVSLALVNMVELGEVEGLMKGMALALFSGYGDSRAAIERSLDAAAPPPVTASG